MDYNTGDEPIITERKRHLKALLILLMLVIVMAGLSSAYTMYQKNNQSPQPVTPVSEFTATGLADNIPNGMLSGVILYRTVTFSGNDTTAYLGMYTVNTGQVNPSSVKAVLAALPVTATTTLVLQNVATDATKYQLGFLHQNNDTVTPLDEVTAFGLNDLSVSNNNTMYAYSFQTIEATSTEVDSVNNWSIAIHTNFSGDAIVITEAIHPQWVDNSTAVIFMKTDGLYRIDLLTNEIKEVAGLDDRTFTVFDGLAVSKDSTKVLLTNAKGNQIEVLSLSGGGSVEVTVQSIGQITSPAVNYSNPLFSPDSQYYSVVATRLSEPTMINGLLDFNNDSRIEIRYVTNADVMQSVKIDDETKSGITLLKWLSR